MKNLLENTKENLNEKYNKCEVKIPKDSRKCCNLIL